jgi:hypothetical protein
MTRQFSSEGGFRWQAQLGHASIRVTKDVYGHPMPSSRAKAAEAMRKVLFEDDVRSIADVTTGLVTQLATCEVAE